MKKNLIAVALVAGVFSAYAMADDGIINFIGEITDDACTITNDVGNPLQVTLGTVSRATLDGGAGKTASPTAFNIQLTNCPASVSSATVKFDGASANGDNTALALTQESGVATGVGIQITDPANVIVPLYTASTAYPLQTGTNSIPFVARYLAVSNSVSAGPANATTNFTVNYN